MRSRTSSTCSSEGRAAEARRTILAALLVAAGAARAQQKGAHEVERGPMGPAAASLPRYSDPGTHSVMDAASVQCNVGPNGMNVLNDAANEPSLAVDPTAPNRIVVTWRNFASITSDFRQAGVAFSRDGGRTFTNVGPLDAATFRSDPVVRTNGAGKFFYYSLTRDAAQNYTCQFFASTTGGQTWAGPTQARGGDKAWIAIDRTGGAGQNNIYAAWDRASVYDPLNFTRSRDGGSTFDANIAMPNQPNWGTVAVGPSGQVYVAGNTDGNLSSLSLIRSSNAATAATPTFDLVRTVNLGGSQSYFNGIAPNPDGLLGQIWVAADTSGTATNGFVYVLASVDPPGADPLDVMVSRSTDGGSTWSAPIKVNDEAAGANAFQWFGTLGVAPSGRLDAVWMDTKNTGASNLSELRYATSANGGLTWTGHQTISATFNSMIGFPMQNKIGDYIDIHSDRTGCFVAYAATFTGGQDVYCVRVGPYDCNGNGIDDALDIASGAPDCNGNGIPDSCEAAAGVAVACPCYANCDGSTTAPVLNVNDFTCFLNLFAAGDTRANCDGSTSPPILNVNDFTCFLNRFAAGCT